MAATTNEPADDFTETASFKIADQKVCNLIKRLHDKRVCPCCTGRALLLNGAWLVEEMIGSAETIVEIEQVIAVLRKNNRPAPPPMASTEAH